MTWHLTLIDDSYIYTWSGSFVSWQSLGQLMDATWANNDHTPTRLELVVEIGQLPIEIVKE